TDQCRREAFDFMPTLKKFAAEGTYFPNAYTPAPLCQPARVSMMTGCLPHQTGICGNGAAPISDALRAETYPNLLQKNGYFTAMVGKHHFVDSYGKFRDITQDNDMIGTYGFNHVLQVLDDGENGSNEDAYTHFLRDNGMLEQFRAVKVNPNHGDNFFRHVFDEAYTAEHFIFQSGIDFVRAYDKNQPLYLQWSFIGPHPPLWHYGESDIDPSQVFPPVDAPDTPDCRERRAHYLQKCRIIDGYIGQMLALFKEKGLYDNTIFIFTSDHGDNLGDHGIWDKRNFYEGSVGVPLLMVGPGIPRDTLMNGDKKCKAIVSLLDLYPTILKLAGVSCPRPHQRFGRDLLPMILEERGSSHPYVISELGTCTMIRTANWKMIYDPQQGGVTGLFNLKTDANECINLAGNPAYITVVSELIADLFDNRVALSQYTHERDQNRIQKLHIV
ncbi:MAG: sulfatase-like hydrolase/transferase, partial [Ruthenibacterium sp.]